MIFVPCCATYTVKSYKDLEEANQDDRFVHKGDAFDTEIEAWKHMEEAIIEDDKFHTQQYNQSVNILRNNLIGIQKVRNRILELSTEEYNEYLKLKEKYENSNKA